jgi:hypothetical protein
VPKRVCYIHIGPHKTGTKSIQWFLSQHRAELLEHGYLVPESGNIHGGHHAIARTLCGQEVPERQLSVAATFVRALGETSSNAVVISSEALDDLLRRKNRAKTFFNRMEELNLEAKLIFFPRNQSQSVNSRYVEVVKSFRCSAPFEVFVRGVSQHPSFKHSLLIELADAFHAGLIARPFTEQTIRGGVVRQFLECIGLQSSQFPDTNIRRNQGVGPFAVSVARRLLRLICSANSQLKWLQAERCKKKLSAYLEEKGWMDTGYCGLTAALAHYIERQCQPDNDAFAQRVWGRPWAEIFTADIDREFMPNDLELCGLDERTDRRLSQAVREMTPVLEDVMRDPCLAVDAVWNDLRQRAG